MLRRFACAGARRGRLHPRVKSKTRNRTASIVWCSRHTPFPPSFPLSPSFSPSSPSSPDCLTQSSRAPPVRPLKPSSYDQPFKKTQWRASVPYPIGADQEIRTIPSGARVATFSLATSQRWNDRDGKPCERTQWHRIVVWGSLPATFAFVEKYLHKGDRVYVAPRRVRRADPPPASSPAPLITAAESTSPALISVIHRVTPLSSNDR